MLFKIFWGTPSQTGTLCNIRELIRRLQVDKGAKTFNVADEFILHVFTGHLIARLCSLLHITCASDPIEHEHSLQWLEDTAHTLAAQSLFPDSESSNDQVYTQHRSFSHLAYLYIDLRQAIRWEDGPHIIRHWKAWLHRFLGTGCKNYAMEAAHLIAKLTADFPKHVAYIAIHNRTANMLGKPGHGKPLDQLMEHYNL